jgi:hypothetical protein
MANVGALSVDNSGALGVAVAEAKWFVAQNAVLPNVITKYNIPSKYVNVPVIGGAATTSASAPSENVAATIQDITGSEAAIAAARVAVATCVSDAINFTSPSYMLQVGRMFGKQIVSKMNQDIFALFDGFSTSVGDTTSDITLALISDARNTLLQAGAPEPYYLAISPYVHQDLADLVVDMTSGGYVLQNTVMQTGVVSMIYGVNVLIVNDLAAGSSTGQKEAASLKCGMFSGDALAMNIAQEIQVNTNKNILKGATEVVADCWYGVAELVDSFGVEMICDNKD